MQLIALLYIRLSYAFCVWYNFRAHFESIRDHMVSQVLGLTDLIRFNNFSKVTNDQPLFKSYQSYCFSLLDTSLKLG